ncbi:MULTISPECIES: InlB B-repeat-containing protein [Bacillaceae]|uniref:Tetratricopeptide repeat protein n=1 Tax=Evansella alkalicola TaxID=745819 RepID=A0ABS6JW17_9BACI|nr:MULTISPECIES: tetratricopeptide repeat protein [Bacillaceae]MBU9722780.1 tetratricopeptide repeat protein [Bacillus alkalicola]
MDTKKKLIIAGSLGAVLLILIGVFAYQLVSASGLERKLAQADAHYQAGEFDEAIVLYTEILEEDEFFVQARLGLALSYFATEQYDLEEQVLLEGIALDPDQPSYYLNLSDHYVYLGKIESAVLTTSDGVLQTEHPELDSQLEELRENLYISGTRVVVREDDFGLGIDEGIGDGYSDDADEMDAGEGEEAGGDGVSGDSADAESGEGSDGEADSADGGDDGATGEAGDADGGLGDATVYGDETVRPLLLQVGFDRVVDVIWEDEHGRVIEVAADWVVEDEEIGLIEYRERLEEEGLIGDGEAGVDGGDGEGAGDASADGVGADGADGGEGDASDEAGSDTSAEAGGVVGDDGVDADEAAVATGDENSDDSASDSDSSDNGHDGEELSEAAYFSAESVGATSITASVGLIELAADVEVREQLLKEIVVEGERDIDLTIGESTVMSVSGVDYNDEPMEDFAPSWRLDRGLGVLTEVDPFTYEFLAEEGGIETVVISDGHVDAEIHIVINREGNRISYSVSGEGRVVLTPNEDTYVGNSVVGVSAVPADGWVFVEWRGDLTGSENPTELLMNNNKTFQAVFEQEGHSLSVSVDGGGTVEPSPSELKSRYADGESVTLRARNNAEWVFVRWTGDVPSGAAEDAEISVVMDRDKNLTAVFEEREPDGVSIGGSAKLSLATSGNGSISGASDGDSFDKGDSVTLTAVPNDGWQFERWAGDVSGSSASIDVKMEKDMTVEAVFVESGHNISLTVENSQGGTVTALVNDGSGDWKETTISQSGTTFAPGTRIRFNVTVNEDWEFAGWTGISEDNPRKTDPEFTVNGGRNILAEFRKKAEDEE